jgi:putative transposase
VIHRLITQWAGKAQINQMCRVLEVSRSGYYAARKRAAKPPAICAASVHAKAAFEASGRSYGSRRLSQALKARGLAIGRHRSRTLMRINALRSQWRRKFVHTTDSRHGLPVAANVLDRQFKPAAPDQAWVCDITYIRTRSGWLYLAAVLDLYSRRIVGWAMAPSMPAQLVCAALRMAIVSRQPKPGLLVHSDRGSQYASEAHTQLLAQHSLIASMSRKGNCWDNAVMERFFLNLRWSASGIATTPTTKRPRPTSLTTSLASTTPSGCIPHWAIARLLIMSGSPQRLTRPDIPAYRRVRNCLTTTCSGSCLCNVDWNGWRAAVMLCEYPLGG